MSYFDNYFSEKAIVLYLCKKRANIAQQRSKKHLVHLLTNEKKFNYHINTEFNKQNIDEDVNLLYELLPPRRRWKKLKKGNRITDDNHRINSIDYNIKSLLVTISFYKKTNPSEPFLIRLNAFINQVRFNINDKNYKISEPKIIPALKTARIEKVNVCRPISQYGLMDSLIISFTNKYLTNIFDPYFYNKSFAFRAVQRKEGQEPKVLSHHDAVNAIVDYKNQIKNKKLYVAECDISKFYDSVHHTVIKRVFKKLIVKVKLNSPLVYSEKAERIFYQYLDSYSFVKNVLKLNGESSYWTKFKIPNGEFGWIEKELINLEYFKNIANAKIGVPQGGAISGLIANLVLDYADKEIVKVSDEKTLYTRFCDDMVLIHPNKNKCKEIGEIYINALKKLKLIPHEFEEASKDNFWSGDIKSKKPYLWSHKIYKNSFQRFGFVGYEINFNCELIVRKNSLEKEKIKQKKVVLDILSAIRDGKRKTENTIVESAANRLIGMSVGRIKLSNFKTVQNEMCWNNGFKLLKDNPKLRKQARQLDFYRTKQIFNLKTRLLKIAKDDKEKKLLKVGKYEFLKINGLSKSDSVQIRDVLKSNNFLNSKYEFDEIKFNTQGLVIVLNTHYQKYESDVQTVLLNLNNNRKTIYYGKPFSYYYHIIERNQ